MAWRGNPQNNVFCFGVLYRLQSFLHHFLIGNIFKRNIVTIFKRRANRYTFHLGSVIHWFNFNNYFCRGDIWCSNFWLILRFLEIIICSFFEFVQSEEKKQEEHEKPQDIVFSASVRRNLLLHSLLLFFSVYGRASAELPNSAIFANSSIAGISSTVILSN